MQNIPPEAMPILARYERNASTPKMVAEIMRSNFEIDVRSVLPTITVPTLVLHAQGDPCVPIAIGRWLAEHIPTAEFVELQGAHSTGTGTSRVCSLRRLRSSPAKRPSRRPTGCSRRCCSPTSFRRRRRTSGSATAAGEELLDRHDDVAKRRIARHRGRLVKTTGDGLLATFDGPARVITCAQEIVLGAKPLGLDIRAGLHTGEVELRGDDTSPASES